MDTISLGQTYFSVDNIIIVGVIAIVLIIVLIRQFTKRNNNVNDPPIKSDMKSDGKKVRPTRSIPTSRLEASTSPSKQLNICTEPQSDFSKCKYIGYYPLNIFAQTEPLSYPFVIMPKQGCVIKFPQKGRSGRKGYKEDCFLKYIQEQFSEIFKIYDDRYLLAKINRYEPDFSLLDEKNGMNIFLDVEIDEPYEGINDVSIRKATHYQYSDINRNNEFKSRGWIVIRFAEIQVHRNPLGCCRFIADVIKSINPQFEYPARLSSVSRPELVNQWTEDLALQWSQQRYREQYLGIEQFGYMPETSDVVIELKQDTATEKEVVDENIVIIQKNSNSSVSANSIMVNAIQSIKYITFVYQGSKTVVKPLRIDATHLFAFCYVKNKEVIFIISDMKDIHFKDKYYTLKYSANELGINQVANIMNIVIPNHKYVRMEYTRKERNDISTDPATGDFILNKTLSETIFRTISNIQLDIEGWGEHYIKAYCNTREAERTFYFARISMLEILDL